MELDLSALESAAASLAVSVPKIQTGVVNLKAENEALRASVDPTAQSRVNTIADNLVQVASALQDVANSLPVIPDPGTPA